jgi:DNA modification methylase
VIYMKINRIIVGKSQVVLKTIPNKSVDLIVTSPPYNFGMDYDDHDDSMNFDDFNNLLKEVFTECERVLKDGGRMAINIMPKWDKDSPTHHTITTICRELGLKWFGEIVWLKEYKHSTAWGSWASPSNPSFISNRIEFIEVFYKTTKAKVGDSSNIDIIGDEFKSWIQAVWEINAPNGMKKKFGHPAIFPEDIPMRLIKLLSYKNDIVLDPFNGVGTTTKVAHDLERFYIGIDISKDYCKTALKRIQKAQKDLSRTYGNKYPMVRLVNKSN